LILLRLIPMRKVERNKKMRMMREVDLVVPKFSVDNNDQTTIKGKTI